jgi:osmotically inducible lipoprotein OsmB
MGDKMRRFLGAALVTVALTGSTAASELDRNIFIGTALGAATGAAIGAAAGGPAGTWIGLAVGGAAGGMITYLFRPDGCYIRTPRGELWQTSCQRAIRGVSACYVGNEVRGLTQIPCPTRL